VAADPRIDALEVVARWPCEARARAAAGQLPAPALIAASSLALAGREPGRLCNPGLPGHRQLTEETLRGTGTTARRSKEIFKTRAARDRRR